MVSFWCWGNGRFCFQSDLKLPRPYNGWHDQDTCTDHFFLCSPPPQSFVQTTSDPFMRFPSSSLTLFLKNSQRQNWYPKKIMPAGNRMETEAFSSWETGQQRDYCLHFVKVYCQIALTSTLDLSICCSVAKFEMLTEQHQCSQYRNFMRPFAVELYAHHDKTAVKKGTLCLITST